MSSDPNKNSPAVAISAGLWYIIDKESAARQTVSTFLANQLKNDRRVGSSWGGHFFVCKDFPCDIEHAKADVSPFFNDGSVCFLLSDGQN
ncbi:hypothetical protein [Faecalibacterium prausnitzii]|uniref:hypothetical protein n=1 Tax=Faecalibacterium prausnitzii TaxID=853 RepID=UPI0012DE249B|nr:hypothetical protein [Faecalibacterium prausnitzii]